MPWRNPDREAAAKNLREIFEICDQSKWSQVEAERCLRLADLSLNLLRTLRMPPVSDCVAGIAYGYVGMAMRSIEEGRWTLARHEAEVARRLLQDQAA